ncbi:MAG: hypothetical protein WB988_19905, partial [Candidatus Nitrosopolaris sp.]
VYVVLGLVKGLSFRARAQAHGRPVPPLVAHVLAAVSTSNIVTEQSVTLNEPFTNCSNALS